MSDYSTISAHLLGTGQWCHDSRDPLDGLMRLCLIEQAYGRYCLGSPLTRVSGLSSTIPSDRHTATSPDIWINSVMGGGKVCEPPVLYISLLHNGFVSGGSIIERGIGYSSLYRCHFHRSSQGLFLFDGSLSDPESFCLMDSGRSLPYDLFHNSCLDDYSRLLYLTKHCQYLDSPIFYCGTCHSHYGHFLIEFLPRLWSLQYFDATLRSELVLVVPSDGLPIWISDFLNVIVSYYGLAGLLCVGTGMTVSSNVIIQPSLCYESHTRSSWEMRKLALDISKAFALLRPSRVADLTLFAKEKIFLTRKSSLPRWCIDTPRIERQLIKYGYKPISLEEFSIAEQLFIVSRAKDVFAFVGSATYTLLFAEYINRISVLAPRDFFLRDDCLVSSLLGSELRVSFGSCLLERTTGCNDGVWACAPRSVHSLLW